MADTYNASINEAAEAEAPVRGVDPDAAMEKTETEEVSEGRRALVTKMQGEIENAEKKWAPVFKQMKANMKYAAGKQYKKPVGDDDRLKVEIVQRHVAQRTAALYARNPTVVAKRKPRLDFVVWDGKPDTLLKAAASYAETGVLTPQHEQLFNDVQQGFQRRKMMNKLAKTLELLYAHFVDMQDPPFKGQAKRAVPRTITCGVAYGKVGYQRIMQKRPETEVRLDDATTQLAVIERLRASGRDDKLKDTDAEYERLTMLIRQLGNQPEIVLREGLVFNFPRATSILPDCRLEALEGFVGTHWVAEKFYMSTDDVKETYGKAVSKDNVKTYSLVGDVHKPDKRGDLICVYEVYHKRDGMVYVLTPGHKDFLREPQAPDVYVRSFYPWFPLVFNRHEDEDCPFPRADVELLMPLQNELNRTFESLRQHRVASRPLYVSPPGALEEEDKENLSKHEAHDIIELANLPEDGKIDWVLKQVDKAAIDPNVYTVQPIYEAIGKVVGGPETAMGGVSRGSATGDSIAEASRVSALASNADDLDDWLTQIAEAGGGILLLNAQAETVQEVVGPGYVWPELRREDVAREVYLSIRGGSTGRPNKAQEIANFERMYPLLVQLTGISQDELTEYALSLMDDTIDLADFVSPGAPSLVSMNANSQPGTGDPKNDPYSQGDKGGDNKAQTDRPSRGGQPGYPTGTGGAPVG